MDETAVYMELIRENIDYDIVMHDYEWKHRDMYEELYQVICDVVCVPRQVIRIEGEDYTYSLVKKIFEVEKITFGICDCLHGKKYNKDCEY